MAEEGLNKLKNRLGFSDEEMKKLMENPKNIEALKRFPDLVNKTIIVEVIKSHGCEVDHQVGDKFVFNGFGNLLTKLCPKRICLSALNAAGYLVHAANTLLWAGQDPNKMLFQVAGCSDVGLECGGWGNIVMKLRVEDRK